MPGGVDLHSHIAGSKINIGRLMRPEAEDALYDYVLHGGKLVLWSNSGQLTYGDTASRWFDGALIALILINFVAVILESIASLQLRWGDVFNLIEQVSLVIFSLEYLLRVWSIVDNRWREEYRHPLLGRLMDHPQEDRFDTPQFIAALQQEGFRIRSFRQMADLYLWVVAVRDEPSGLSDR